MREKPDMVREVELAENVESKGVPVKTEKHGITLVPRPSDDPRDPLVRPCAILSILPRLR